MFWYSARFATKEDCSRNLTYVLRRYSLNGNDIGGIQPSDTIWRVLLILIVSRRFLNNIKNKTCPLQFTWRQWSVLHRMMIRTSSTSDVASEWSPTTAAAGAGAQIRSKRTQNPQPIHHTSREEYDRPVTLTYRCGILGSLWEELFDVRIGRRSSPPSSTFPGEPRGPFKLNQPRKKHVSDPMEGMISFLAHFPCCLRLKIGHWHLTPHQNIADEPTTDTSINRTTVSFHLNCVDMSYIIKSYIVLF